MSSASRYNRINKCNKAVILASCVARAEVNPDTLLARQRVCTPTRAGYNTSAPRSCVCNAFVEQPSQAAGDIPIAIQLNSRYHPLDNRSPSLRSPLQADVHTRCYHLSAHPDVLKGSNSDGSAGLSFPTSEAIHRAPARPLATEKHPGDARAPRSEPSPSFYLLPETQGLSGRWRFS